MWHVVYKARQRDEILARTAILVYQQVKNSRKELPATTGEWPTVCMCVKVIQDHLDFNLRAWRRYFPVPTPSYLHVANPHVNTNFR